MNRVVLWRGLLLLFVGYALADEHQMEIKCTKIGRVCADEADCVNQTCVCRGTDHGVGMLACARENEHICLVLADPHVLTFNGARGNIYVPCRYRLATFEASVQGDTSGTMCLFQIFGFNLCSQSRKYFAAGVEILLALSSDPGNPIVIEINHADVVASTGESRHWGSELSVTHQGVSIVCDYHTDQKMVSCRVPACQTTVKFRPYNELLEPGVQAYMPGIGIITGEDSVFGVDSQFPRNLCGTPHDPATLFFDAVSSMLSNNSHLAVMHAVIEQGRDFLSGLLIESLTKVRLPKHDECVRAYDAFSQCEHGQGKDVIRFCTTFLSRRTYVDCLRGMALDVFTFCLNAYCGTDEGDQGGSGGSGGLGRSRSCSALKMCLKKCGPLRPLLKSNPCQWSEDEIEKLRKSRRQIP